MQQLTQETKFWLCTTFQNTIQTALQLNKTPAPQQTPYIHKYEAIQNLKKLIQYKHPYNFITCCVLGQVYSDVQQTHDSIKSYQTALKLLKQLPKNQISLFLNYLMIVYNMLGLNYVNQDQNQNGIGCLGKAYDIYEGWLQSKGDDVYNNRCHQPNGRIFKCYYQGGIDHQQMEDSFTLTLFYLAQAYTKVNLKEKAAEHCGRTLQRQYQTGKYEINEFCHNLIGLASYYEGSHYYSQGQYLLSLALKILPQGKKKKMRAIVQIALGNLISAMLKYCCHRIANGIQPQPNENDIISKQFLLFSNFDQKFPKLQLANQIQGSKSLFRQANTQYKKALEVFVLDGYVTQHIDTLQAQSKLYQHLVSIQQSKQRAFSMCDKRRQLLQPLLTQLNPKAYPATWQKILVEVAEIYNQLFTFKNMVVLNVKQNKSPSQQKLQSLTNIGKKLISYYQEIVKALLQDKDTQKNQQYYRSVINAKFNIAKTMSRLLSSDKKIRVEYLKQSWKKYQDVLDYIQKHAKPRQSFQKQYSMTQDVIIMMPNRIDRINYGQVSPLE